MDVIKVPCSLEATPSESLQRFECFLVSPFAHVPSRALGYQVNLGTDKHRWNRGTTEYHAPLGVIDAGRDLDSSKGYAGNEPQHDSESCPHPRVESESAAFLRVTFQAPVSLSQDFKGIVEKLLCPDRVGNADVGMMMY